MVLVRSVSAMILVVVLSACTQPDVKLGPTSDGPRYMQPGVGSGPKQTDAFGNDRLSAKP